MSSIYYRPSKARSLIEEGVQGIEDLELKTDLLTERQKTGLKHVYLMCYIDLKFTYLLLS